MININDIKNARERINPYIVKTPLIRVPALDDILNCQVYLKPENLQITGSFKIRGAANHLLALSKEEKENGVICSSSGNHAQGVAYASKVLGVDATIVMPENANPTKLKNVEEYGAKVLLIGTKSFEREIKVKELVEKENRTEIHPYADDYVRAGQGTITLEILEDNPDIDTIVAPIGGGGLISGVSIAAKAINPDIQIVGVEPAGASRYSQSLQENRPVMLDRVDTIADGTRTDRANPANLKIIQENVDFIVSVEDKDIKEAMKLMVTQAKLIAEPSSVMPIAAAKTSKLGLSKSNKVCFILSGGNNDLNLLSDIITNKGE